MSFTWSHIAVICKVLLPFVQMKKATVLLVLCVSVLPCASGYANGAGATGCDSMTPGHPSSTVSGAAPYMFTVTDTSGTAVTEYSAGQTLRVTITPNSGETFKGFLLKVVQSGQTAAVGSFDASDAAVQARCTNGLTHTNAATNEWTNGSPLVVEWTAPSPAVGNLEVYATIVRTQSEYWVKVQPNGLTVLPEATIAAPTITLSSTVNSVTVEWSSSGYDTITIYNNNGEVHSGSFSTGGSYEIPNLSAGTQYSIRVDGSTGGGSPTVVFSENKATKPEAPTFTYLAPIAVTENSITVSWNAPTGGADTYDLTWEISNEGLGSGETFTGLTATSRTVGSLSPGVDYSFTLVAIKHGERSADAILDTNTEPTAPVITEVNAGSTSSIIVKWVPAPGSIQTSYTVTYQIVAGSQVPACTEVTETQCTIDLDTNTYQPGTGFTIRVFANKGAFSSTAVPTSANTKPLPPENVIILSQSETSISLQWSAPEGSVISTFAVTVDPPEGTGTDPSSTGGVYLYSRNGLTSGKEYTFSIVTVSGSENSEEVTIQAYTTPPQPVAPNRVSATTSSITVAWSEPAGGEFTKYRLTIAGVGTPTQPSDTQRDVSKGDNKETVFSGLFPGGLYSVTIVTVVGTNPEVISTSSQATFRIKPLPAQNLRITSYTETSLIAEWNAPNSAETDHTRYEATIQGLTEVINLSKGSTLRAPFSNLQPGTQYTVELVTYSEDQPSETITVQHYTKPNAPRNLRQTAVATNSITVAWDAPDGASGEFEYQIIINEAGTTTNTEATLENNIQSYTFDSGLDPAVQYDIKLISSVGSGSSLVESNEATVQIATLSTKVLSLTVDSRTTSSVEFSWSRPNGITPDSYRVTLLKEGDQNAIVDTTSSTTSFQRSGLTAGLTYVLTVIPIKFSVEGESDSLSVTLVPLPVDSITITYIGQDNVELEWVPPAESTGFDGFEITVVLTIGGNQVKTESASKGATTIEITGLSPGVSYTVRIITSSNNQFSEVKELLFETLPEGIASIELEDRTDTSLSVTWAEPQNTDLATYDVSISPNDGGETLPISVNKDSTLSYVFNNLVPGKVYTVSVTVVASSGSTSAAVSRPLQTLPSAVLNLNSGTVTETSIVVSWSRNSQSLQNKFQITYTRTGGTGGNTNTVEVTSSGLVTYQKEITSLSSGYSYEIKVTAFSNAVESEAEFITVTTVPKRVTNVLAIASTSTNVAVSWLPDPNSRQTAFKVSYRGMTIGTTGSVDTLSTATSASFSNLFPGERYEVTVEAVSGSRMSSPETQQVVTLPLGATNVHEDPTRTTTTNFRIVWDYNTAASRVTQWTVRHAVVGGAWTERSITEPNVREAFFTLGSSDSGRTFDVEIIANSDGASSTDVGQTQVTLKPQMTSILNEVSDETLTDTITLTYTQSIGVFDEYIFTLRNSGVKDPVTKTKADPDRTVRFNGLEAGTMYTIEAVTRSGSKTSDSETIDITTVPNKPEVELNQEINSITVIITKPAGGVDSYEISCNGPGPGCPNAPNILHDNSARVEWIFQPLVPSTTYRFEVIATKSGKTSAVTNSVGRTEEGVPGKVSNLRAAGLQPYEVTLIWDPPLAPNGIVTGYTVSYTGTKNDEDHNLETPVELDADKNQYQVEQLIAGFTYIFEVRAKTNAGVGIKDTRTITTPIRRPEVVLSEGEAKPKAGDVNSDSIEATFVDPFDQRNGRITAYTVVVTKDKNDPDLENKALLYTWKEAQNTNLKSWLAISPCATFFSDPSACEGMKRRRKRDIRDESTFIVGSQSCEGSSTATYCNGPLEESTPYYLALRGLTEDGQFSDAPYSDPIETGSGTNWLVIGLIIALIILLILFVLVVLYILYRRGRLCNRRRHRKDTGHGMTTHFTPVARTSSHRKSAYHDTSRPVKLAAFPDHVAKMAKDTDFKFSEEFEDLKHVGREQPTLAAELAVNRNKNRFTNILPYDSTRVKLLPTDDEEGSDYINANYMPGYNSKREFIVCQGTLPSTRDDFWRMTWEQNCRAIVMLTKCVEKGREKCDHYWPVDSEPMFYGDLQVTILNETRSAEWVVTEFKLAKGEQFRKIKHFHYIAWPDFGTPEKPQSLIRFVRLVRAKVGPEGGPVIVHCSAGVGRSGTYIALDHILHQLEEGVESVDIYGIVHEMRNHRVWMVQTEQQYICIHQCLLCILEGREDDISPYQGEDNEAFDDDEGITMETN